MSLTTLRFLTRHPLTRGWRLPAAILRFLRWQIRSRLTSAPIVVNWFGSARLLVTRGMTGATGNIYAGLHEFEDMAFLVHLLRKGDLFLDIGANVGSYTVLAAKGAGAKVVAFEPVPSTFRHLRANVALNDLTGSVETYNLALGATNGTLSFTESLDTVNHVVPGSDPIDPDAIQVTVTTLDAVVENRSPVAMKINVEGFEHEVLAGARDTLRRESLLAVVMELNGSGARYGFDELLIDAMMIELGFERCTYRPFTRTLEKASQMIVGTGNVIYVSNREEVTRRLKTADRFEVFHQKF